jgi:hypothetical protein
MTDLPQAVVDGLKAYYEHRKAHNDSWARKDNPCIPWDKEADTDAIFAAAKADMWQSERMAGTFWFKKEFGGNTVMVEMNEEDMPHGKRTVKEGVDMDSEVMSMLNKVFEKKGRVPIIINSNDRYAEKKLDAYDKILINRADAESLEEQKKLEVAKGIAKILRDVHGR